ncbi:MAG: AAA family ATPase [Acidobacteria bacterium]|nr:AAA family ATPase [Acidobacteriota bacterium]
MLRRMGLANFKCFQHLDLPCASLNLLCGLNGMGKSSVIQALLVLRQSFETGDLQDGRLVLGGSRIDLGAGSDVLFEDAAEEVVGFVLRGDGADKPWAAVFGYSRTGDQLLVTTEDVSTVEFPLHYDLQFARDLADSDGDGPVDLDRVTTIEVWAANKEEVVQPAWEGISPFGGRLVYVEAERVGPRKSYPLSEMLARRGELGGRGEYTWNYLNEHQDALLPTDDPRCAEASGRRLVEVVDHWLQDVSPGARLELESIPAADAVIAGFTFDRAGDVASRRHRAANVGFGLSYVLPVILALLSEPGTLCLIENPEAHLHPRGQTKLAELAVRAAAAGVQVFAETRTRGARQRCCRGTTARRLSCAP